MSTIKQIDGISTNRALKLGISKVDDPTLTEIQISAIRNDINSLKDKIAGGDQIDNKIGYDETESGCSIIKIDEDFYLIPNNKKEKESGGHKEGSSLWKESTLGEGISGKVKEIFKIVSNDNGTITLEQNVVKIFHENDPENRNAEAGNLEKVELGPKKLDRIDLDLPNPDKVKEKLQRYIKDFKSLIITSSINNPQDLLDKLDEITIEQGDEKEIQDLIDVAELIEGKLEDDVKFDYKKFDEIFCKIQVLSDEICTNEIKNKYYLAGPYQGMDLAQLLENSGEKLSKEERLNMSIALLDLVSNLHDKGFAHLDIKPENITIKIDKNGFVNMHLIDFGSLNEINSTGSSGTEGYIYDKRDTPIILRHKLKKTQPKLYETCIDKFNRRYEGSINHSDARLNDIFACLRTLNFFEDFDFSEKRSLLYRFPVVDYPNFPFDAEGNFIELEVIKSVLEDELRNIKGKESESESKSQAESIAKEAVEEAAAAKAAAAEAASKAVTKAKEAVAKAEEKGEELENDIDDLESKSDEEEKEATKAAVKGAVEVSKSSVDSAGKAVREAEITIAKARASQASKSAVLLAKTSAGDAITVVRAAEKSIAKARVSQASKSAVGASKVSARDAGKAVKAAERAIEEAKSRKNDSLCFSPTSNTQVLSVKVKKRTSKRQRASI